MSEGSPVGASEDMVALAVLSMCGDKGFRRPPCELEVSATLEAHRARSLMLASGRGLAHPLLSDL